MDNAFLKRIKNRKKRKPTTKQSTTTQSASTTKATTTTKQTTVRPSVVTKAPKRKAPLVVIPDVPLPGNNKWRGPGPKPGQKYPKSCHDIFVKHAEKCNKPTQGFYAIQVKTKILKNLGLKISLLLT